MKLLTIMLVDRGLAPARFETLIFRVPMLLPLGVRMGSCGHSVAITLTVIMLLIRMEAVKRTIWDLNF